MQTHQQWPPQDKEVGGCCRDGHGDEQDCYLVHSDIHSYTSGPLFIESSRTVCINALLPAPSSLLSQFLPGAPPAADHDPVRLPALPVHALKKHRPLIDGTTVGPD